MLAADLPLAFFAPEDPYVRPNNGVGKKSQDWLPPPDHTCSTCTVQVRVLKYFNKVSIHHIRIIVPVHTLVVAAPREETGRAKMRLVN